MQQQHGTTAPHAPVVIDPQAHVSRYMAKRVRELIGQVRVWSVDGHDLRQYRAYKAAGVRLPRPTLVRGTVASHRLELSTDQFGRALGRCDCRAAGFGQLCSHLLALAVHAISIGWEAA
jgi:hypothetical protein